MASIYTGIFPGSTLPTALRAPTPVSASKTSAINSVKPLMISGCCPKSDVLYHPENLYQSFHPIQIAKKGTYGR